MFFSTHEHGELLFLTWTPDNDDFSLETLGERAYASLASCLREQNAVLLHERIFSDRNSAPRFLQGRERIFRQAGLPAEIPPTCVEGAPFSGNGIAGIHAIAIHQTGTEKTALLKWNGQACGRLASGKDAQYLSLSDMGRLVRQDERLAPDEETRQTLEAVEQILEQARWSFKEIRRTWFYLSDILDWYDDFNRVRNATFKRLGLLNGNPHASIPASTGIKGRNLDGGWCTLDILAMRGLDGQLFETRRLVNPKQNEAVEYGSAFARALSVKTPACQYLFVSGTASIDEKGVSLYSDDFERQTVRTLENVAALLGTAGAGLRDICQATAFVKRPGDISLYHKIARDIGLDSIPVVCTLADVCRDELLFELDATAMLSH